MAEGEKELRSYIAAKLEEAQMEREKSRHEQTYLTHQIQKLTQHRDSLAEKMKISDALIEKLKTWMQELPVAPARSRESDESDRVIARSTSGSYSVVSGKRRWTTKELVDQFIASAKGPFSTDDVYAFAMRNDPETNRATVVNLLSAAYQQDKIVRVGTGTYVRASEPSDNSPKSEATGSKTGQAALEGNKLSDKNVGIRGGPDA